MSVNGQEMKVNGGSNSETKFSIENVLPNGGAEVITSVWNMKTHSKMMMIDTTITIHGKVGATYKLTLDQYGTTTNREVIDTTGSKFGGSNFDMSPKISSSGLFCEFPEKSIKQEINGPKLPATRYQQLVWVAKWVLM
ncbi:MAG: hypothetical protein HC905_31275 [Bacteroidales bacterium]|nr:hypothetical protein [Bacteroidales bacterium]